MCGIVGIIGLGYPKANITIMGDRIVHRGPDGRGKWNNEHVGFQHLRLSIIDLNSRADQPMVCLETGNVLVFNGEIYNFKELKESLRPYYTFHTNSDTEVILAAYYKFGSNALGMLRGMFSLALYDNKRNVTLVARDRLGIKPFYYRTLNNAFLFASEIKSLVNLPETNDPTVSIKKVYGFLAHRHLDTDNDTFFQEVKHLPPASYSWVTNSGELLPIERYWEIPIHGNLEFGLKDQILFKEKIIECTRLHLISDVPIGCFVSGGLDSSTIACIADNLNTTGSPIETFSSILAEKNEENALISNVQASLKHAVHHEILLDGSNFLDELPIITYHHDEPLADGSMYSHWELCKLANKYNIKVLLSGNGGDEVLGGYSSHVYSLLGQQLKYKNIANFRLLLSTFLKNRNESLSNLILRSIQEASPFPIRENIKRYQGKSALKLLNGNFSDKEYVFYPQKNDQPFEANYLNNLTSWTVPPFLHYEDRNSMAFGVEIRVPMLDHQFIEFVSAYRPEELLKGRSKQALRSSMRGVVPNEVLDQKEKFGFAAPLEKFVAFNKDRTFNFFKENIYSVPFLNHSRSMVLARSVLVENNMADFQLFWRVLSLSVWYNKFFNG